MRRILFVLSSVGLLGAAVGCHCTQGVCDCDFTPWGTPMVPINAGPGPGGPGAAPVGLPPGSSYAPALAVPTVVPGPKSEPIKAMPKADAKPKTSDTKNQE